VAKEERNYLRKEERNLSGQKDVEEGLKRDGLNIANVTLVYVIRVNAPRNSLRKLNYQGKERILILSEEICMILFKWPA
jgi:hypothetical protein